MNFREKQKITTKVSFRKKNANQVVFMLGPILDFDPASVPADSDVTARWEILDLLKMSYRVFLHLS